MQTGIMYYITNTQPSLAPPLMGVLFVHTVLVVKLNIVKDFLLYVSCTYILLNSGKKQDIRFFIRT